MTSVSLSIGGSILAPNEIDIALIRELARMLGEKGKTYKLYITVGGGGIARRYIKACREFGVDETFLDEVGITATRLNASVLIAAFGDIAYHQPAENLHEAVCAGMDHQIVVMGGTHPGHTTDGVAAMIAEKVDADRIINATNVDGVYTADPKKDRNAKLVPRMTPEQLMRITNGDPVGAGSNFVLDPMAIRIVARSGIPVIVVNGRNVDNLGKAIVGKGYKGTLIRK